MTTKVTFEEHDECTMVMTKLQYLSLGAAAMVYLQVGNLFGEDVYPVLGVDPEDVATIMGELKALALASRAEKDRLAASGLAHYGQCTFTRAEAQTDD